MASDKCPDILRLCETFLEPSVSDGQVLLDGYDLIRKDKSELQNKSVGGLNLYFRSTFSVKFST